MMNLVGTAVLIAFVLYLWLRPRPQRVTRYRIDAAKKLARWTSEAVESGRMPPKTAAENCRRILDLLKDRPGE